VRYRRGRGRVLTDPSRFLEDVSEDLLEPVELVEEKEASEQLEAPSEKSSTGDKADGPPS
jgi:DNA helicase-2/ATP-dependent DNA helicase PcrA